MRTWKIACVAAILAFGISAAPAHADEWNKLTYLTFSSPVALPGVSLPAGTYRFELMDPDMSRRVIRVSSQDGSKTYGIFLSISDQRMEPANDPVVLFREMPAGLPQAVRAWFYPGETHGYEFVYPHDQATKIARATHQSVLAMNEPATKATTDSDRVASMRSAQTSRIDENGRPVSSDEQLKNSSKATTSSPRTSPPAASTTTASSAKAQSTTARNATTSSSTDQNAKNTTAVGTAGRARTLPRTASPIPAFALLSLLSLVGAAGVHVARKALA